MQWEETESGVKIVERGVVPVVRPVIAEAGKEV
jgi:hypothetical protein